MANPEGNAETNIVPWCTNLRLSPGPKVDARFNKELKSRISELKTELENYANSILQEDDHSTETIIETIRLLSTLKKLNSIKEKNVLIPESFFMCPLSRKIMDDPVILSTGETYDRPYIERALKKSGWKCPKTMEVLPVTTTLTSNDLVRDIIRHWRNPFEKAVKEPILNDETAEEPTHNQEAVKESDPTGKSMKIPKPPEERFFYIREPGSDLDYLNSLLDKLEFASTFSERKEATRMLRGETKKKASLRALFGKSKDAITRLISPFSKGRKGIAPDIEEDVVATICHISRHDDNFKLLGKTNPVIIPLLIQSCKFGTKETGKYAVASLDSLSQDETNTITIGNLGAIKTLIKIMEEGHPLGMENAAFILLRLCKQESYRADVLNSGVVNVIINKINARQLVEVSLSITAILSQEFYAIPHLTDFDVVQCLLGILRHGQLSDASMEQAIGILNEIAFVEKEMLRYIEIEEEMNGTISELAARGTSFGMMMAKEILKWLNKAELSNTPADQFQIDGEDRDSTPL